MKHSIFASSLLFGVSLAYRIEPPHQSNPEFEELEMPDEWRQELAQIGNVLINNPFKKPSPSRPDRPRQSKPFNAGRWAEQRKNEATMPIQPWHDEEDSFSNNDQERDVKLPSYDRMTLQCHGTGCLIEPTEDEFLYFDRENEKNEEKKPVEEEDPSSPPSDGDNQEENPLKKLKDALRERIKEAIDELERSLDRTRGHQYQDPIVKASDRSIPRDDRPIHAWSFPNPDEEGIENGGNGQTQARKIHRKVILIKKDEESGRVLEVNQINLNLDVDVHQKQAQQEKQANVIARKDHNNYRDKGDSDEEDDMDERKKKGSWINFNVHQPGWNQEKPIKLASTENWKGYRDPRLAPSDSDLFPSKPNAPRKKPLPRDSEPENEESFFSKLLEKTKELWNGLWKGLKAFVKEDSLQDQLVVLLVVILVVIFQVIVLVKVFSGEEDSDDDYELVPGDEDDEENMDDLEMGERSKVRIIMTEDKSLIDRN